MLLAMAEKSIAARNTTGGAELERIVREYPNSPQAGKAAIALSERVYVRAQELMAAGKDQESRRSWNGSPGNVRHRGRRQGARDLDRFRTYRPEWRSWLPASSRWDSPPRRLPRSPGSSACPRSCKQKWFGFSGAGAADHAQSFYIDRTEVTNEQYKAFVNRGARRLHRSPSGKARTFKPGATSCR